MSLSRRSLLSVAGATLLSASLPDHASAQELSLFDGRQPLNVATVKAVTTRSPVVAMTFDDGPHPTLTPRLLDILAERRIKATFYLIGRSAATWPHIVKRIADEGHEIGNHTWNHPFLDRRSDATVFREIDRTTAIIQKITGRPRVTFRPPYGAFSHRQQVMLHRARRMPTILWSVDPLDWRRPGPSVVASRIVRGARPGSIILSHDIHPQTIQAMPRALDDLKRRGLRFTTVSELMGWPRWQSRRFRPIIS